MKIRLNIENWNRKEHFEFFNRFEEPFFGITVRINCTKAYHKVKNINKSFFLFYLHSSIKAANMVEAFRYRIEDAVVYIYDQIKPSATISREDGTFAFTYFEYNMNFLDFCELAEPEISKSKNSKGINPSGRMDPDVIHYSTLPWIDFQSLTHSRNFKGKDSCPKISFGKLVKEGDDYYMSMSVHVHHGLVDGLHVGAYVENFQKLMDRDNL